MRRARLCATVAGSALPSPPLLPGLVRGGKSARVRRGSRQGRTILAVVAFSLRQVTGFEVPVIGGGLQWQPTQGDIARVQRVITDLEPRRVLFSTYTSEVPEQCVISVIGMRDMLTSVLADPGISRELTGSLRLMRGACVTFLTRVGASEDPADSEAARRRLFQHQRWQMHDYEFGEALGELRAMVGLQLALLADGYGLDINGDLARDLARILPTE